MNIVRESILDFKGDCIVNPANSFLNHDGGLAKIIANAAVGHPLGAAICDDPPRAARREVADAWIAEQHAAPLVATGNAVMTSAGLLPYKGIIHAVGPIWNGGHFCEASLLLSAYTEALSLAENAGFESIAFPAISCGVFGFPVEKAAKLAVTMLRQTTLDVSVYLMDDAHVEAYKAALDTPT